MCRGSSSAMPRGTLAVSATNAHTELALCPWAQSWMGEVACPYHGEWLVVRLPLPCMPARSCLPCGYWNFSRHSLLILVCCWLAGFCCCSCRVGVLDVRRVREDAIDKVHVREGPLPPLHRA